MNNLKPIDFHQWSRDLLAKRDALTKNEKRSADQLDEDVTVVDRPPESVVLQMKRRNVSEWAEDVKKVMDYTAITLALSSDEYPRSPRQLGESQLQAPAENFVRETNTRLLFLGGNTGVGKTVAATWIASMLKDPMFWLPARMVYVREEWNTVATRSINAPLLVIDDLGTEPNEWASQELTRIIEIRYDRGYSPTKKFRTVVTTNLSLNGEGKKSLQRYGERLISRLADFPSVDYVFTNGADLRSS